MKEETQSFYEQVVLAAVRRVTSKLDEALDLEELARAAQLSPLHFHRIFRGMLGETPLELHRRIRLERAARALVGDGKADAPPITRIAFDAGYETHESFTRAFRQAYGSSPSEFRERARQARRAPPGSAFRRLPQIELAAASEIHFEQLDDALRLASIHFRRHTRTSDQQDDAVTIEQRPALRVFAVSHRGPYSAIAQAFGRLDAIVRPQGFLERYAEGMVAIYHDDPEATSPADLRADAGVIVRADAPLLEALSEIVIPAGSYARTTHVGPYTRLGDAWARFMGGWLVKSGHRVGSGVSYERYLNTPMDTRPEDLRTDLYLSIAAGA